MLPLVILDLDGTLVGSDAKVAEPVWKTVKKVQEAGMKLAVCTGRPCEGMAKKIAESLDPNNPHIFQNGALTCFPNGKLLKTLALPEAVSTSIVEYARLHSLTLEVYTPNEMFIERKTSLSEVHAKMIGVTAIIRDLIQVIKTEPVVRAQWVVSGAEVNKALEFKATNLQVGNATSPALPSVHFISLTSLGVSKGSAVKLLAKFHDIELSNVMAVGDSLGDKSMLEVVGYPIVMEGSPEELTAIYPKVSNVENNGVIEALERALFVPIK